MTETDDTHSHLFVLSMPIEGYMEKRARSGTDSGLIWTSRADGASVLKQVGLVRSSVNVGRKR